jgi:hypothetical protein
MHCTNCTSENRESQLRLHKNLWFYYINSYFCSFKNSFCLS